MKTIRTITKQHYKSERDKGHTTHHAMYSTVALMLGIDIESAELYLVRFYNRRDIKASYRRVFRIVKDWQRFRAEHPALIKQSICAYERMRVKKQKTFIDGAKPLDK
tara:strand:- start:314 stop:634 length:321 start_codon:yes stop_codon:yes gene_type:complete